MIETLTVRGLQFVALVLGGRAARGMLLDFYQARGLDETLANEKVFSQTKTARKWVIPIGLISLLAGASANSIMTDPGFRLGASISIYFGIFMLACQLPRGNKSTASWDSLKSLFKK